MKLHYGGFYSAGSVGGGDELKIGPRKLFICRPDLGLSRLIDEDGDESERDLLSVVIVDIRIMKEVEDESCGRRTVNLDVGHIPV